MKTLRLSLLCWLWLHLPAAQALCVGPLCSCTVSTGNVVFGSINPIAIGSTDSTGSARISCGGTVGLLIPYQIELGPGGSGDVTARRMSSGANSLSYVSVRQTHLELTPMSVKDRVHLIFAWTR